MSSNLLTQELNILSRNLERLGNSFTKENEKNKILKNIDDNIKYTNNLIERIKTKSIKINSYVFDEFISCNDSIIYNSVFPVELRQLYLKYLSRIGNNNFYNLNYFSEYLDELFDLDIFMGYKIIFAARGVELLYYSNETKANIMGILDIEFDLDNIHLEGFFPDVFISKRDVVKDIIDEIKAKHLYDYRLFERFIKKFEEKKYYTQYISFLNNFNK